MLALAAQTILAELGPPPAGSVFIFACAEKLELARAVAQALEARGVEQHILLLGPRIGAACDPLKSLVKNAVARGARLIFLLDPAHAPFLFEVVGRPDSGLHLPAESFFCDWLMRPEGLLRTLAVDREEILRYRKVLLDRVQNLRSLRITTPGGTDLTLCPRAWHATLGEIYTAPLEEHTHGRVVIDACAYSGRPARPFTLSIQAGRVTNLDDLDRADPQQNWLVQDLTRDANASRLAELGIGINPGARWDQDLMESEQARGTCHVGFGNNRPYGGENGSDVHVDLVMRDPKIEDAELTVRH